MKVYKKSIEKNNVPSVEMGKKGVQKNLPFLPSYFSLFKNSVIATIIKCVRFLYLIPSILPSISFIKSSGSRIVTFCNSVFLTILYFRITHLNINTCNYMHLFALHNIANRSGQEWIGITY